MQRPGTAGSAHGGLVKTQESVQCLNSYCARLRLWSSRFPTS
jgi:hypothetical protein